MILVYIPIVLVITYIETNCSMNKRVKDLGWEFTKSINVFLRNNVFLLDLLTIYNTFSWLYCIIYSFYQYINSICFYRMASQVKARLLILGNLAKDH